MNRHVLEENSQMESEMEGDPPTTNQESTSNSSTLPEEDPTIVQNEDVVNPPQRHRNYTYPLRIREPKRQWDESLQSVFEPLEPESFKNAMASPDASLWKIAMQEEYDFLIQNQTWTLKQLTLDRSPIKSRWVFKIKPGIRGAPPRYKARLVAKGFLQHFGLDYGKTFAPVAKQDTLRVVLSVVAAYDLEMHQLDVKTAFLYGELNEEIYLEQTEGFEAVGQEELVCHLRKCLYWLKQASRVWNRHFDAFLKMFGLTPSQSDAFLYLRHQGSELTMVEIWVDDGLVCGNTTRAQYLK